MAWAPFWPRSVMVENTLSRILPVHQQTREELPHHWIRASGSSICGQTIRPSLTSSSVCCHHRSLFLEVAGKFKSPTWKAGSMAWISPTIWFWCSVSERTFARECGLTESYAVPRHNIAKHRNKYRGEGRNRSDNSCEDDGTWGREWFRCWFWLWWSTHH